MERVAMERVANEVAELLLRNVLETNGELSARALNVARRHVRDALHEMSKVRPQREFELNAMMELQSLYDKMNQHVIGSVDTIDDIDAANDPDLPTSSR